MLRFSLPLAALFFSAMPAGAAELPVDYLEGSWVRITAAGDLSGTIDCDDAVPLMRLPPGIGHARGVLTFVRLESGWSVLWQRPDGFPDVAVDLIALEGRLDSGSPYIVENFPVITFRRNSFRAELRLTGSREAPRRSIWSPRRRTPPPRMRSTHRITASVRSRWGVDHSTVSWPGLTGPPSVRVSTRT